MIQESGRIANFKYSDFGGKDWVFVKKAEFNEFSTEEQKKITESLKLFEVKFIIE